MEFGERGDSIEEKRRETVKEKGREELTVEGKRSGKRGEKKKVK